MKTLSEKISLLNEVTIASLSEPIEEKVIKNFTEAGLEVMSADYAFVWAYRPSLLKDKELELKYSSPDIPFAPQTPREQGSTAEVMKTRKPLLVENYGENGFIREDAASVLKSVAVIPIFFKNDVYGCVFLCYKNSHTFSEEDKSTSIFLGNSIAQGITISRLILSEQQARMQAENQEARFRSLIENSYDAIALLDETGSIIDVSNSIGRISGFNSEEILGKSLKEFVVPDDFPYVFENFQNTLFAPKKPHTVEFRFLHKDGSVRWMEAIAVNLMEDPKVGSVVVNVRDATERKKSAEMLEHQALHDPLTSLPNRKEFESRFVQAVALAKRQGHQLALMFLDMDRFKNVNDRLGHSAGDTLLKVVASRIQSSIRAEDTVARFGGDEFLILVNEVNQPKDAGSVAEKILKAVSLPLQIGEHTIYPTVSIGIALYPGDGIDKDSLKRNADVALYKSKEKGRNRYAFYDHSMDGLYTTEKLTLEKLLREAMEYGQIELHYQPIVSLKKQLVISLEALARWNHPDKGLLPPIDFIPFAEESGLIIPLEEHIIELALKQYGEWKEKYNVNFKIAVNVSAVRFSESNFAESIFLLLKKYNIPPTDLELEITETAAMSDLEASSHNLKHLKSMGVSVSIDDFGTGYSSLSYLKRLAINSLKIDKSFIHNSIVSPQDTSITRTIIAMAKTLNLKVIAEGVETKQQMDFLTFLGCDAAQGFFISQPLQAKELIEWVKKWETKPVSTYSKILPQRLLSTKWFDNFFIKE